MAHGNARRVIVAGGGASGLIAAVAAAEEGADVTVLEAEKTPGKKLLVTGSGRCNMANAASPKGAYFGADPSFAERVLSFCPVSEVLSFFRERGLAAADIGGYFYPRPQQAQSVLACLLSAAKRSGVRIRTSTPVVSIKKAKAGFTVEVPGYSYEADAVILAGGSPARVEGGGSCGALLDAAVSLGHGAVPMRPALVPLQLKAKSRQPWGGVRTRGRICLSCADGASASDEGELQLTDYGVSGIPAFNVSMAAGSFIENAKDFEAFIDFCPELSESDLSSFIGANEKRGVGLEESLAGLFPKKLSEVIFKASSSGGGAARLIKHFPIEIEKTLPLDKAQAASGGASTDEIEPSTMESRIVPGIYLVGEMTDAVGRCGGFNLQYAFAGGILAGRAAAKQ